MEGGHLARLPQPLNLPGFGVIDRKLYIAGGYNGSAVLNTLYIYNIDTNTWTMGANLPQPPVAAPGSTVFNNHGTGLKLYVYGGILADLTLTNVTLIYDPHTDTWSRGPDMNVSRGVLYGTAVGDDRIVAPGGSDNDITGFDVNEQLINVPCGTATPTPTPTATLTPTATSTATATPTATARPFSTPRPRPTPAPRRNGKSE